VALVIQDDGIGFELANSQGGLGLVGMRERVESIEGRVRIASKPNQGTTIRVEIPLGVPA
jgi:signal transduction histidine kinase